MNSVLEKLASGDLRSEGRAAEVAGEIVENPQLVVDLASGLGSKDKLIRARSCMTLEIVSRQHPELLTDVQPQLIRLASTDTVPQVRWHLAEILGRVALSEEQTEQVIAILLSYLDDRSKIVKYCAVQTLGTLGRSSPSRTDITRAVSGLGDETKSLAKAVAKAQHDLGAESGASVSP
jgi:hypothetical protein